MLLLLCLATSGCGYGCYSGFWNGIASGVAFSNSSCPLPKATGDIFVTLRGIQARPSMIGGEDSYSWQELAPDLAAHPLQLDLLARSSSPAASAE